MRLSFKPLFSIISFFLIGSTLIGCGSNVFRNRDFDYLREPVIQSPPLKTPAGQSPIAFEPAYSLPAGPESYPQASVVSLTPPGFDDHYTVQKPVASVQSSKPAVTSQKETASPEELKGQVAAAQASLDQLKTELGQNPPASTIKTAQNSSSNVSNHQPALETGPVIIPAERQNILTLPADLRDARKAVSDSHLLPIAPVSETPNSVASNTLLSLPDSSSKPGALNLAPPVVIKPHLLNSQLSLTPQSAPVLSVEASQSIVWGLLPNALAGSGFVTVNADSAHGFYFVAPEKMTSRGNTRMLFVTFDQGHTLIIPYNTEGVVDDSSEMRALLQYLQQHFLVGS